MESCISWYLSWRVASSHIINDQIVENMFFSSDDFHSDSYLLFLFKTKSHLKHTSKKKHVMDEKVANNPCQQSQPNIHNLGVRTKYD